MSSENNIIKDESKKPSKLLLYFSKKLLNISNKKIIKKAKKDKLYKQFIDNFKASIQFTTRDDSINKYIVFDGKGGIEYRDGKINNPDSTIMYRSVKDLFIFYRSFGDVNEGLVQNRFEMQGNLNILFKYGFLSSYINPKKKKIKL